MKFFYKKKIFIFFIILFGFLFCFLNNVKADSLNGLQFIIGNDIFYTYNPNETDGRWTPSIQLRNSQNEIIKDFGLNHSWCFFNPFPNLYCETVNLKDYILTPDIYTLQIWYSYYGTNPANYTFIVKNLPSLSDTGLAISVNLIYIILFPFSLIFILIFFKKIIENL